MSTREFYSFSVHNLDNPQTFSYQNLDISKLEQNGQLQIIQLADTQDDSQNEAGCIINWGDLVDGEKTIFNTADGVPMAVLIDDLDTMELLAPSAAQARSFVCRLLSALGLNNNSDGKTR